MPEPLILRDRRPDDLPALWRWFVAEPEAEWRQWDAPYFHEHRERTAQTLQDYVTDLAARPPSPDLQIIDIGGAARGIVTRSWEEPEAGGWLELGIIIFDPAYWGGGHGTQALRTWTDRSFAQTHAHVIMLTTWGGNLRMIRAAERVGYRECGRVREARLWQGQRFDSVRLDVLRREWESR